MSHVAKAITGAIVAGAVAVTNAVGLYTPSGENVTGPEWWSIVGAVIAGSGLVWLVPNSGKRVQVRESK